MRTQRYLLSVILVAVLCLPLGVFAMHAGDGPTVELAKSKNFSASVQLSAGVLQGEARELVYDYDYGYRRKLSELIWDLKDLYFAGGVASVQIMDRFRVNAGFWGPMNKGSGQMEDYDWMYEGMDWSDWSLSDVDVDKAYMYDINASFEAFKYKQVGLRGILGYRQDHWEWKDYGIRHIYTYYNWRDDRAEDDGSTGIEYEQTYKIPYLGAGLSWALKQFELYGYFLYSPLVKADDRDHHIYRDLVFEEDFENGDYYGYGIRGTYTFKNNIFLSGSIDGQTIPEILGDTTINGESTGKTDDAGIKHSSAMANFSVGYKF